LILPLKGPQEREGKALLEAAQLAVREEQARGPLRDGRQLQIAVRDESGPWGQVSMEILRLVEDDHALAILTSANGTSAHLAEQIANKISVPILTLSSDPSTTQANVPWLFRAGPSDTDQAQSFSQRIYSELRLRNVLVVAQTDHDGRVGAAEFEKAVKELNAPAPVRFDFAGAASDFDSFRVKLATTEPNAVVIWTDAPPADALLSIVEATRPWTLVFLCRKAAQLATRSHKPDEIAADHREEQSPARHFTLDREQLPGESLSLEAQAMYDAVHIIATALRRIPSNRALLRAYLANQGPSAGNDVKTPFDSAGNDLQKFSVVQVQAIP
jgi:ABC-type branched-subunit amino acid transport system substrate-binding protein